MQSDISRICTERKNLRMIPGRARRGVARGTHRKAKEEHVDDQPSGVPALPPRKRKHDRRAVVPDDGQSLQDLKAAHQIPDPPATFLTLWTLPLQVGGRILAH